MCGWVLFFGVGEPCCMRQAPFLVGLCLLEGCCSEFCFDTEACLY